MKIEKEHKKSTLINKSKSDLVEHIMCLEHNNNALYKTLETQAANFELLNTPKIEGRIDDSEFAYQQIVRIKPIEHHYEEPGEQPYIKYGCPICEMFCNRHSLNKEQKTCPLCGVNLLWDGH